MSLMNDDKLQLFDEADHLATAEEVAGYLEECAAAAQPDSPDFAKALLLRAVDRAVRALRRIDGGEAATANDG